MLSSFFSYTLHVLVQLLFTLLCSVLPLHTICCASDLHYRSYTPSPSTHMHCYREKHCLFSILHVFLTPSPLSDHHQNSSYSLEVILNSFIINSHYPKILWLLWELQLFVFLGSYSQSFWLLWILSPFLYVITGGDHTPIQKSLCNLSLASAISFFRYDLGRRSHVTTRLRAQPKAV
jgi:hypothetical protein